MERYPMELKQLEYFRAIVDAGTISGAARDLHMTQPPLSYQMKMLEEELQVPLFLRGTKKITLTEAGKTLYEQGGNLLMLSDLTKREVIKSSQAATLHIGMTPSTVSMMSDYLLRFAEKYPQVHFDVHEGSTFTDYTPDPHCAERLRDPFSGKRKPAGHGFPGSSAFRRPHVYSPGRALRTAADSFPSLSEIYAFRL